MAETDLTPDVSALTVQLLSAYLANNTVPAEALAELIRTTKDALTQEATPTVESSDPEVFTPAVSARKSLASPEHILSLIDGRPYKTLKRHLASRGLTPEEYRTRYNLPASYPMVAPAYAEQRRTVAQRTGLGRKGPATEVAEEQSDSSAAEMTNAPEPQADPAIPANSSKKTSTKQAKPREQASTDKPEVSAETAASATRATKTDKSPAEPSSGTSRKSRSPKPAAENNPTSAEPKPRAKRGGKSVDSSQATTSSDAAEPQDAAAETKPSKRRGKLGLFNAADSGAVSSSKSADAPSSAEPADDQQDGNQKPTSPAGSKARGSKRMARSPQSGTA